MKTWFTKQLDWSDLRALVALPAIWIVGLLLVLNSLFFVLALLSVLMPFAALVLLCLATVAGAFVSAWVDLSGKSRGRRSRPLVRYLSAAVVFTWLLLDLARYPFFRRLDLTNTYPWRLVPRLPGSFAVLVEPIEWISLATTVWMLIELLVPLNPRPRWNVPPLARGWAILILLLVFVGYPVALERYHFYQFIHSPASTDFRTFGPGTIGESLCKRKDVKSAQERVDRLGATMKDDELRWLLMRCSWELTSDKAKDEVSVNAKLIGLMGRVVAMHLSTAATPGYCGVGQKFLEGIYTSFEPQYLESAREDGLPLACLTGPHGTSRNRGLAGHKEDDVPVWWSSLARAGAPDGYWRDQVDELKHLGIDIRQKSLRTVQSDESSRLVVNVWGNAPPRIRQLAVNANSRPKPVPGSDALSGIDIRESPTSPLIEVLVDEGLDVNAPSDIDGIPLVIRVMYWRHATRTDDPVVLRLWEKLGDPPVATDKRILLRIPTDTQRWSDDEQTRLWTWIETQVGPAATADAVVGHTLSADERQFPKLNALAQKLLDEKLKTGP
jgi:hypothetical protein